MMLKIFYNVEQHLSLITYKVAIALSQKTLSGNWEKKIFLTDGKSSVSIHCNTA